MELPPRSDGDKLLPAGELTDIRRRLRAIAPQHDLTSVIVCAFDHRTHVLPFVFADTRMVSAGVRAIGSAMVDSGFPKTRIVQQQWSHRILPSRMRLDGRTPDVLMVSALRMHIDPCTKLIRDACGIPPSERPLIIAGGPGAIYEPWNFFSPDPADPWGVDIVVTGEEYVLLAFMERLLAERSPKEPVRAAFVRARDRGLFDDILGLVYAKSLVPDVAAELIDTGIQRMNGDLDELPSPVLGYALLEPPGRRRELAPRPVPPGRVAKLSPMSSIVMTMGCKFRCQYCPIPAYNQRLYRTKSPQRIIDDLTGLSKAYGLRTFFGADDNFFNDTERTLTLATALASATVDGQPLRRVSRLSTEATVHDTLRLKDHLPLMRKAGIRALWIGVEDMSGALVKKGQGSDETTEAFRLLRKVGILPMPMMMHHDDQPLYTFGRPEGLLNQIRLLQKAGANSLQVLMITPSQGSKLYVPTYTSGMVYESVGRRTVEPYMIDGNYVIASHHKHPWRKQLNLLAAYAWFYNPLRMLWQMLRLRNRLWFQDVAIQAFGMLGLCKTIRRTAGWLLRLMFCKVHRHSAPPSSQVPLRAPDGGPSPHDLPKKGSDPFSEEHSEETPESAG